MKKECAGREVKDVGHGPKGMGSPLDKYRTNGKILDGVKVLKKKKTPRPYGISRV